MPKKPPLIIGVKCKEWRGNTPLSEDGEYQGARKEALVRDKHTCQYCGFKAKKYQETHHVNDDHNDNSVGNLLTCCALCHSVHHIGMAGMQKRGLLVYVPEMSQAHINRLGMMFCAFHVGVANNHDFAMKNYALIDEAEYDLKVRSSYLDESFNDKQASDPLWMANLLLQLPSKIYAERHKLLKNVRILPLFEGWKSASEKRTDYWSSLLLSRYESCDDIMKKMLKRED